MSGIWSKSVKLIPSFSKPVGLHYLEFKLYTIFNYEISKRVAVICFDDNEFYKLLKPTITSLIQPVEELGIESVRILIDDIKNKKANKMKNKTVYSARLIERESC